MTVTPRAVTVAVPVLAFVMGVLSLPRSAAAFLRADQEDVEIVTRAELMVVGAIKDGSVVIVPHAHRADEGASWETRATLLVGEVIKGHCEEKELPIIIHYGLDVFVDNQPLGRGSLRAPTTLPVAKTTMAIIDTGNSDRGGPPMAEDARKDHIWLLRRATRQAEVTDTLLGIQDPEDVQPIELRKYLELYLLADPEPGVRAILHEQPDSRIPRPPLGDQPTLAGRALRYLQHREIGRILEVPDPARRVERLLPYYRGRISWHSQDEARAGIIAAGAVAGPYLLARYDPGSADDKDDIIRIWGRIQYQGCAPILMENLKRGELFWSREDLKGKPWNADRDSPIGRARRESCSLIYISVAVLGDLAAPRNADPASGTPAVAATPPAPGARELVEQTRQRWAGIAGDTQIVPACDQTLRLMDGK